MIRRGLATGAAAVALAVAGSLGVDVPAPVLERRASAPASGPTDRGVPPPAPGFMTPALGQEAGHLPYDGAFTFTRIRYRSARGLRGWGRGNGSWAHDYPDGDRNLQTILDEFTSMAPSTHGSNVLDLENREIFRHPILYISEPGYWGITEEGARNLREHLLKGGFLIFDDFEARQWDNMAAQMERVLPEGRWVEVDGSHLLFQSFFSVEDIYVPHPLVDVTPRYMVIFEDNDPAGRVMVLANHNSDLAEYWEYSARGFFPVDPTNDAYRLGVNYIIYGLTH